VKDGNHGSNHPKKDEFADDGLPFITATQVNRFRIDYETAYKLSGAPLDKIRIGFAIPGDVILTHKGSIGRVAVSTRDCVLSPQTTYYRVNSKAIYNH
jgi:type I restriction enzyme, S subunit